MVNDALVLLDRYNRIRREQPEIPAVVSIPGELVLASVFTLFVLPALVRLKCGEWSPPRVIEGRRPPPSAATTSSSIGSTRRARARRTAAQSTKFPPTARG